MAEFRRDLSSQTTQVLLIEADPNSRSRHAAALERTGYQVVAVPTLSTASDVEAADVILTDWPTFQVLQHTHPRARIVVVADDVKLGVTACLCGASDWVPVNGSADYLVDAVNDAANRRGQ